MKIYARTNKIDLHYFEGKELWVKVMGAYASNCINNYYIRVLEIIPWPNTDGLGTVVFNKCLLNAPEYSKHIMNIKRKEASCNIIIKEPMQVLTTDEIMEILQ